MKKIFVIIASALVLFSGCSKQFEVEQSAYLTGTNASKLVEQNPEFLLSYVSGMYAYMVSYGGNHDDFGFMSINHNTDLMCQNIAVCGTLNWGTFDIPHGYGAQEYRRARQAWNNFYTLIAKANEIIDFFGEADPENVTLQGYLGQAYAMRALSYTYLMFLYQDPTTGTYPNAKFDASKAGVPIIYATRDGRSVEEVDAKGGRNTLKDVMTAAEESFTLAEKYLSTGYERASKNEIDYSVVKGLEARYFLLTQQWEKAYAAAAVAAKDYSVLSQKEVATNGFMEVEDPEVIWGFNHSTETMTSYASFFSHCSNECQGYGGVGQSVHCCDKALYDKIPATDVRKSWFNGPSGDASAATTGGKLPYAGRKFGYMASWLQDYIYMRVEEMYLIQAESAVMLSKSQDALTAMGNLMNNRQTGWSAASVTLDDVILQRDIELWCEGFEYYDLRRLGRGIDRKYTGSNHLVANQFTFPAHDASWNYQIPLSEIQNNTHITDADQNEYTDPTA